MTWAGRAVDLTISVDGGDEASEIRTLLSLLRDDPRLRGRVELVDRSPEQGEMGVVSSTPSTGRSRRRVTA